MDNRSLIVETVKENPGISFTELKDETGLANGTLQYHIRKSDEVSQKNSAVLENSICEECDLRGMCGDKCLLSILRDTRKHKILEGLHSGKEKQKIAEQLDIDPSTLSYHIKSMREQGILDSSGSPREKIVDKL